MEFIIKFGSEHESFRVPEIEALAVVEGIDLTVLEQSQKVGTQLPSFVKLG